MTNRNVNVFMTNLALKCAHHYLINNTTGGLATQHGALFQRGRRWLYRSLDQPIPASQVRFPRNLTLCQHANFTYLLLITF